MDKKKLSSNTNFLKRFRLLLVLICMSFCLSSATPDTVNAATVRLNVTKKTICLKNTLKLKVQGTKKKVKWKSSKTAVATVSSSGKVTAKKTGSAVITAKVGNKTYKCKVTVKKHSYRKATLTQPRTCTRCGATSGSALGDGSHPSPQQVYKDMVALKKKYPEGKRWTNDNYYYSPQLGGGYGCAGFAFALSDAAFGNLPARKHTDFTDLKVGDILRVNGNTHSVVILEITSDGVILAEGNFNSSIHWGRTMSFDEIERYGTYVTTRYPQ